MQISGVTSLWLFETEINRDSDMPQLVVGQVVIKFKQSVETISDVKVALTANT